MKKKVKKIYFLIGIAFLNAFLRGPRLFFIKNKLLNFIGIKVGKNTKVVGPLNISTEAKLLIGDECWVGRNFSVDGNGVVVIGSKCDIAPDVLIATGSHQIGGAERRAGEGTTFTTKIGDGTWIGVRSTIIEGSRIGEGCIIGASTLINKDINNDLLVVGIPAKVVRILNNK